MNELLDMGIPRGRARAALERSKGDAMAAAERIFAGEFDDIPSDDEEVKDSPAKALSEDQEMQDDNEDEDAMSEYFAETGDEQERLLSDPYAGIFFSKDRVETEIEPVEKVVMVNVSYEDESGTMRSDECPVLGIGDWLSGCPEQNEQSHLFQHYRKLTEPAQCPSPGCSHRFNLSQRNLFAMLPSFAEYTSHLRQQLPSRCSECGSIVCLACLETVTLTPSPSSGAKSGSAGGIEELMHCSTTQGLVLGLGLRYIEKAFQSTGRPPTPSSPEKVKVIKGGRTSKLVSAIGTLPKSLISKKAVNTQTYTENDDDDLHDPIFMPPGLDGGDEGSKGIGYAGSQKEDSTGQQAAQEAQSEVDKATAKVLSEVEVYLPRFDRPGGSRSSDHLVHPTALAHLRRRSGIVNDLLKNDSLMDMTNRAELYQALFHWLEIVSSHEALASMLAMPQMRFLSSKPSKDDPSSNLVTYEGAASPRELLESCVIQAQAALKGLKATERPASEDEDENMEESGETDEENNNGQKKKGKAKNSPHKDEPETDEQQLERFCQRIIKCAHDIDRSLTEVKGKDFVERMRKTLPKLSYQAEDVKPAPQSTGNEKDTISAYEEWAGKVAFQYCDMTNPTDDDKAGGATFRHAFDTSLQAIGGYTASRRSLAIAKELAVLTRNLPVAWHSTIFLRVDETRVDCIKAMIVGPEGTPYENGLFVFDIFLPVDYNYKCPLVKYMTTNGGKYRYNPNLYADGKVCLSLLGTWSGPGWIAGQSTLLQVLISIQSLILCEEPYLNEPGWAGQGGSRASKAYSANVRRMVMVDAMANNIKSPPYPFEDEVKTHFRLKANYLRKQLDRWKDQDDNLAISSDSYVNDPGVSAGEKPLSQGEKKAKRAKNSAFDNAAEEVRRLLTQLEMELPTSST